jgi:hypothetical protein
MSKKPENLKAQHHKLGSDRFILGREDREKAMNDEGRMLKAHEEYANTTKRTYKLPK